MKTAFQNFYDSFWKVYIPTGEFSTFCWKLCMIFCVITGAEKSSIYQHFLTLRANHFYKNWFLKFLRLFLGNLYFNRWVFNILLKTLYDFLRDYGCQKVQYLSVFFSVKGELLFEESWQGKIKNQKCVISLKYLFILLIECLLCRFVLYDQKI